jgi:predicted dehydrogenase
VQLKELALQAGPVQSLAGDMRRVRRRDADFSTTAVHVIDTLRFLADDDYARLAIEYGRCGPPAGLSSACRDEAGPPVARAERSQYASYHALGTMTSGATVRLDATPWAAMDLERYTILAGGRTLVAELGHGKSPDRLMEWAGGKQREIPIRLRDRSRQAVDGFSQEVAALLDAVKRSRGAGRGKVRLPGPTVAQTVQSVEIMEALRNRKARYGR